MSNPPVAPHGHSFSASLASPLTHLPTSAAELAQLQTPAGVSPTAGQHLHHHQPISTSAFFSSASATTATAVAAPNPAGIPIGSNQFSAGQMNHPSPTGSDGSFHHLDLLQPQQQQQQYPQQHQSMSHAVLQPSLYQQNHHPQVSASSPPYSSSLASFQYQQPQRMDVSHHQQHQQHRHQQLQQQASLSFSQRQAQDQAHLSLLQYPASSAQYSGPASPTAWSLSAAAGLPLGSNAATVPSTATSPPGSAMSHEYMSALATQQQHPQQFQGPTVDVLAQQSQQAFQSPQHQQQFYGGLVSPTLPQHQRPVAPAAAHSAGPSSLAVSPALSTLSNVPNIAPAPMSLYSSQPSASLSPISPALAPFPTSTSSTLTQVMASHILPDFPASSSASHAAAAAAATAAATGASGATATNSTSNTASGGDSDSESGDGDGSGENTPQQRTYHIFSRGSYDLMVWAILHGKGPDHRSIARACGDRPMTSKRWNRLQGNLRVIRMSPPGATDGLVYGMVLHPRDDPTLPLAQAQQLLPDADMVEFRLVWRTCTRDLPIVPKEHWDAIFRSVHVRVGPDGRQFHLRLAECIRVITTNYQTRRSRCGITTDHIRQMFTQCECQTAPATRPRGGRNTKSNPPGPSASGGGPENISSAGSNVGSTLGGTGFASGPSSVSGSASAGGTPQQHVVNVNGAFDSMASPSPISGYALPLGPHHSAAMDVSYPPVSAMHSIPSAAQVFGGSAILTPPTSSREVPTLDHNGNVGATAQPSSSDLVASWAMYGSGLKPAPVAMR
ncbi:hypothetical protein BCR44DRAFT_1515909 [Catenaria anguillulae PL171]|uniref:Uncharacterized protein n=1 Tax=Catenaria anguillulae PL171 TaxID=765915 RepID=A0A1Y2HCS4_9FUNG|nr:hypothetical protein BCR44DRAFT_1515909 [Catenaria anguillulae PL171]